MKVLSILKGSTPYQEISDEAFEQLIIKEGMSAIVTLTHDRMRGAAMMNAMMEGLCLEYKDRMVFFYINPESSKLTELYGLYDTAAIFFFANGALQDHQIGLTAKNKLREKVEKFILNFTQ